PPPALLAILVALVRPQMDDLIDRRADLRRVVADHVAEHLALDRHALALVQLQVLGHLAGVQRVLAHLDDHRSIPLSAAPIPGTLANNSPVAGFVTGKLRPASA